MSAAFRPFSSGHGVSFQSRITVVAMITAFAVLAAACVAFVAEQWRTEQRGHLARQTAIVETLANSPTMRRVFAGEEEAADVLVRLKPMLPGLPGMFLVDANGRVLAGSGAPSPDRMAPGLIRAQGVTLIGGKPAGWIVTFDNPADVWNILPRFLGLTAALFFAASGLALFLGRWLAGRVTEPVERLSRVMDAVAHGGDFSQRVARSADDELGRLTDSFNDLLSRLKDNDLALRRTMAELVEARDAAQSANRLKSQFLANMSHEIRTPLNGLLAMTQVMGLETLSDGQRGRLGVIRQSGEALLAILNDVLDVSKIEAGKLELEVEDFDLEAMLRSLYDSYVPVADRKGLALSLEIAPDAAGRRRGDCARLRQVVGNLVANALKFTETGEVRVIVAGQGAGGAEGVLIRVSDTGIGISAEAAPRLFQTFTQADSSTTRRFGGTGLGLAICQELAELMGGAIRLESREGEGSTFIVDLPLPRAGDAAASPAGAPAAEPAGAALAGRSLRVLAAEDNPTNQLVLSTVMGIFGVELTLVDNGRKAVDAWRAGSFDVILMDIQMPEMDGLEATRAIRAEEAGAGRTRVPIVALSAHAMTHQVKEYLAAGFDLHVPKPIELAKLQAAMERAAALGAERAAA